MSFTNNFLNTLNMTNFDSNDYKNVEKVYNDVENKLKIINYAITKYFKIKWKKSAQNQLKTRRSKL